MSVPWWKRLSNWLFRRQPQLVRMHLVGDAPSITGFLVGRWGGHYVLAIAKLHESAEVAVPLEGLVEIPVGNVQFRQRLVGVDA